VLAFVTRNVALIGYAGFALGTLVAYLRASEARGFVAAVFWAVTLLEAGLTLSGIVSFVSGVIAAVAGVLP